jgi:hypothetical protein
VPAAHGTLTGHGGGRWTVFHLQENGKGRADTGAPTMNGSDDSSVDAAADAPAPSATAVHARSDWVEILSAIVLALATIASAWSAYQATRWGGVMSIEFSQANASRTLAMESYTEAGQLSQVDVATFIAWAEAVSNEDQVLQDFLRARFRPEFGVAVDAWVETQPLQNPDAPATPFVMEEYQVEAEARGDTLLAAADEHGVLAREANQTGDNYVLTTVLFASVLFFAGIATKFTGRTAKRAMVGLALAAFVTGSAIIATFPIH